MVRPSDLALAVSAAKVASSSRTGTTGDGPAANWLYALTSSCTGNTQALPENLVRTGVKPPGTGQRFSKDELVSDSQLLPLRAFVAPHLALPSGSQPLPPGAKR